MRSAIEESEPTTLNQKDHAPGYFHNTRANIVELLNRTNDYRLVTPALMATVSQFLAEHEAQITRWIAHPWRVASTRAFILRAGRSGKDSRHFDGWPRSIRKAFILPNGATPETGTTWFNLRNGKQLVFDNPDPCFLLFENSVVEHAAISGAHERPTIEIDIVPARETCSAPVYAGIDGWYPWFPHNYASLPLRSIQP
jgi:hypothetical protein